MAPWHATGAPMTVVVETEEGRLAGRVVDDVVRFAGIPYADSTAGAGRFHAPRPARAWRGIREAGDFGPAAPQARNPRGEILHGAMPPTDEATCLTLNVWYPRREERERPVMVWLHGGAFISGHTGADCYDASALAERGDIVVVTVNYRLGSLGWLAHPELRDDSSGACGNWGLLDQIAALRWVRRNISRFGGDGGNVTLIGQSAGAVTALLLCGAAAARGLFHKVIAQSPVLRLPSLAAAARWAHALRAEIGGGPAADLDALRRCPTERIVAADASLAAAGHGATRLTPVSPVVDGGVIERTALDAAAAGLTAARPALVGTTRDEASFFLLRSAGGVPPTERDLAERIGRLRPAADPAVAADRYRTELASRGRRADAEAVYGAAFTDAVFRAPIARWADAHAASGGRVSAYRIDHESPMPGLGAAHTIDVPLVFGSHRRGALPSFVGSGSAVDALSGDIIRAWAEFARTGSPCPPAGGTWPAYDGDRTVAVIREGAPWATEPLPDDLLAMWPSSI